MLVYICSYTGAAGNGEGITLARLEAETGRLEALRSVAGPSPSWLAFAPDGRHAYAVNEIDSFGDAAQGAVTAYRVDRDSGDLTALNTVGSGGTIPAHGSVHPGGRHLLVANYGDGRLAVLPIAADGSLGPATDVQAPEGPVGPDRAEAAPPGSFAISGHDGSHAHIIETAGRFVLSTDLGQDRIHVWTLDEAAGALRPADPPFFPASAGAGPRHLAFHPNGRVLYTTYEEASQLAVHDWDPATGRATFRQQLSALPPGFAGSSFASALAISRDGRFLYSGNRLHNSIAIFAVGPDGTLRWLDAEWTRGDYPNHVALDPTGRFLFACNRRSDNVTLFRVDAQSGRLEFTGQYLPIGSPNMVVFPPG
ncbi:lactonase family protein [Inquilinus limosus]|uniref:lactonase family protein n=1 Tax=Inquilinus limosus TaxID=171674 RepID=UPI0003F7302C|nr:lactonase family protein [Inquilinus limosus]